MLLELGAIAAGDDIPAYLIQLTKTRLNQVADLWNARSLLAFNKTFSNYTLTPNHQPHLIGPGLHSPDFAVAAGTGGGSGASVRPVKIYGCSIVLNNVTPSVSVPINVRDDDWWHNQRVKSLSSTIPTDVYYSPDFPNGSLFFWPVPSVAFGVELETRVPIAQCDVNDTVSLPPGYELGLTLSTAEEMLSLIPVAGRQDGVLIARAARARGIIVGANSAAPTMATRDHGIAPGKSDGFNYYTGQ